MTPHQKTILGLVLIAAAVATPFVHVFFVHVKVDRDVVCLVALFGIMGYQLVNAEGLKSIAESGANVVKAARGGGNGA